MIAFVLFTLWCHGPLSPFLPAAYEPILVAYARLFSPPVLAIVGALAATAVELPNYFIYRKLLLCSWMKRLRGATWTRRMTALFSRRPFLALWILVWSPLPDWGARVLAANSGYPVQRYLAAVLLGRLPRFWLLAVLGFHLGFGADTAIAIIVGSLAIALAGVIVRRIRSDAPGRHRDESTCLDPRLKSAGLAAPLIVLGLLTLALPELHAQSERLPDAPAIGMTVDRFRAGPTAVTLRVSSLRAGSAGTEVGVALFPQALVARALLLAPDFGASYNLSLSGATVLAKGGLSMLVGLGGGFEFLPGFHFGGGAIIRAEERLAVRLDVTRHFYQVEGRTHGVWSFGLGFAVLPFKSGKISGP
jgi:uncharacterized membrane protein YdjX (TVP38/TMEM64 family)